MSVEPIGVIVAVLGVAVAGVAGVAGRGTSALLTGIAHREWSIFRYKVEQIIAEMDCSDFPKPTRRMCLFLVAGEDRRFYYHPGVDPVALGRAVWKTVFCGCRQGGSTIAMQIVRTVTGRYECTYLRKLLEMILAVRLTHHIGRTRLPALYLWIAYYGWQMNDFRQACLRCRIDPISCGEHESAMLVARLKYPETNCVSYKQKRRIQCRADHLLSLRTSTENNRTWDRLAFRSHVSC